MRGDVCNSEFGNDRNSPVVGPSGKEQACPCSCIGLFKMRCQQSADRMEWQGLVKPGKDLRLVWIEHAEAACGGTAPHENACGFQKAFGSRRGLRARQG